MEDRDAECGLNCGWLCPEVSEENIILVIFWGGMWMLSVPDHKNLPEAKLNYGLTTLAVDSSKQSSITGTVSCDY